ncbi:MAG: DUF1800 family protein [Xanthomonadales bacterium]|nr:DUF1800 family protein [Gammaproteobacteria bacterium]MBT8051060.1 DUF1800 family protein [Gammaproteobacteria bacterium]MBT8055615.1 DUF1800 family protein [Gammaproteobacteria bacterium]NNL05431.1 DUF1800 family protein [Xanthomonadales bacterium]
MHSIQTMIATNRFGLGARPGEAAEANADPRGWLLAQIDTAGSSRLENDGLEGSEQSLVAWYAFQSARRRATKESKGDEEAVRQALSGLTTPRELVAREIAARASFAISTNAPFRERLVRFWANHFTVSTTRNVVVPVAGAFEREAIRPRVTGHFFELLHAAETHPAMLLYLDNAQSVGPNSTLGRRRDRGLNENLAREILELHTVGVDGGYTQNDVTAFARILTGWTVAGPRAPKSRGTVFFDERRHEPGTHTVLGTRYPAVGGEQAVRVLRDLSVRPETARFIATKLARHFIADQPPESAIDALGKAFMGSDGHLGTVSAELVRLKEAWAEQPVKFKTPEEFQVSTLRGLGVEKLRLRELRATYASLGQTPFSAPSPAGWPDHADAWLGPDAVKKRLEWAQALSARVGNRVDPRVMLAETLGAAAGQTTRRMVNGADSREQGLTLILMAPEFQRR